MIGLLGAHRVGKTTLAKTFAETYKIPFVQTDVSGILKRLGVDLREPMTFKLRLVVQEEVLRATIEDVYKGAPGNGICDRTPLDMLAYTLAEAIGDRVTPDLEPMLELYTNKCFEAVNNYFSVVTLLQPGIPIYDAEGKAAPSKGYIEHLNYIMRGLLESDRTQAQYFFLHRQVLSLEQRVRTLAWVRDQAIAKLTPQPSRDAFAYEEQRVIH